MRRSSAPLALALLFVLLRMAGAQPAGFTVYTEPPGACLSTDEGTIVGFSGESFPLPSVARWPLRLHANLEGYQEAVAEISEAQARAGHHPDQGVLQLRPLPRPGPPAWTYALGLVAVLGGLGLAWGLRRTVPAGEEAKPEPPPDPSQLPADQDPRRGTRVAGRYQLGERLGVGGWGSVFRARDLQTPEGPEVAVKLAQPWVTDMSRGRIRLHREVNSWRRLDHPLLVRLLDADPDAPEPYLVMELVDGVPLRERVKPEGMPLKDAWGYLEPLLQAVEVLHETERLAHRDLKPENVMVTSSGQLKLMDFGLAKAEDTSPDWDVSQQERVRPIMGTPPYLAPEQARAEAGAQPMLAADQYALGMIGYELLTGRYPWPGDMEEVLRARWYSVAPDPPSRWQEMPPAFEEAILRMLDNDPEQRYPSVKEARRALAAALTDSA